MEQDISLGAMKVRQVRGRRTPDGACCHIWSIAQARGPDSVGVCKLCGDSREFANYWQFNPHEPGNTAHLYEPAAEGRAARAGVLGESVTLGLAARVWEKGAICP